MNCSVRLISSTKPWLHWMRVINMVEGDLCWLFVIRHAKCKGIIDFDATFICIKMFTSFWNASAFDLMNVVQCTNDTALYFVSTFNCFNVNILLLHSIDRWLCAQKWSVAACVCCQCWCVWIQNFMANTHFYRFRCAYQDMINNNKLKLWQFSKES